MNNFNMFKQPNCNSCNNDKRVVQSKKINPMNDIINLTKTTNNLIMINRDSLKKRDVNKTFTVEYFNTNNNNKCGNC